MSSKYPFFSFLFFTLSSFIPLGCRCFPLSSSVEHLSPSLMMSFSVLYFGSLCFCLWFFNSIRFPFHSFPPFFVLIAKEDEGTRCRLFRSRCPLRPRGKERMKARQEEMGLLIDIVSSLQSPDCTGLSLLCFFIDEEDESSFWSRVSAFSVGSLFLMQVSLSSASASSSVHSLGCQAFRFYSVICICDDVMPLHFKSAMLLVSFSRLCLKTLEIVLFSFRRWRRVSVIISHAKRKGCEGLKWIPLIHRNFILCLSLCLFQISIFWCKNEKMMMMMWRSISKLDFKFSQKEISWADILWPDFFRCFFISTFLPSDCFVGFSFKGVWIILFSSDFWRYIAFSFCEWVSVLSMIVLPSLLMSWSLFSFHVKSLSGPVSCQCFCLFFLWFPCFFVWFFAFLAGTHLSLSSLE